MTALIATGLPGSRQRGATLTSTSDPEDPGTGRPEIQPGAGDRCVTRGLVTRASSTCAANCQSRVSALLLCISLSKTAHVNSGSRCTDPSTAMGSHCGSSG